MRHLLCCQSQVIIKSGTKLNLVWEQDTILPSKFLELFLHLSWNTVNKKINPSYLPSLFWNQNHAYYCFYLMINIFLIFPQICKMDKNFQNIINIADELVAKSYQLQGSLSKMSKVPAEHPIFFNKTTDQIREIGKILKTEGQSLHGWKNVIKWQNYTIKTKERELHPQKENWGVRDRPRIVSTWWIFVLISGIRRK